MCGMKWSDTWFALDEGPRISVADSHKPESDAVDLHHSQNQFPGAVADTVIESARIGDPR
jgi:hypothetical protein